MTPSHYNFHALIGELLDMDDYASPGYEVFADIADFLFLNQIKLNKLENTNDE